MSDALDALRRLEGDWAGNGEGEFPTIDSFAYRETFHFYCNGIEPMLHFEQRTWRQPNDEPLHWESGFLRLDDSGEIEMVNSQNGERVEVMRGQLQWDAESLNLELNSTLLGNDPRLTATRRRYTLSGPTLSYRIWMATTRCPELTHHLEASLQRV